MQCKCALEVLYAHLLIRPSFPWTSNKDAIGIEARTSYRLRRTALARRDHDKQLKDVVIDPMIRISFAKHAF